MATATRRPVTGPCVWRGADLARRTDWILSLPPAAAAEFERALGAVRRRGLALEDIAHDDFELPSLGPALAEAMAALQDGRGFVLLRGLPVAGHAEDDIGRMLWGLGTHLGIGVSQSHRGDRLGRVMDMTHTGEAARSYRSPGELNMHIDPVDIAGLLCARTAKAGGLSRVASAMAVHNAILAERPALMDPLRKGFYYRHAEHPSEDEFEVTPYRIPVFSEVGGRTMCFFIWAPINRASATGATPHSADEAAAFALFDEIASRPDMYVEFALEPGDLLLLNNRLVLHGRTHFTDHAAIERKRLLLRLWLMVPGWPRLPATMKLHRHTDRLGGGVAPLAAADARPA